jgi:hypothetical protein
MKRLAVLPTQSKYKTGHGFQKQLQR